MAAGFGIWAGMVLAVLAGPLAAGEYTVQPMQVTETKAVYGRIESRFVAPARGRIGGTLTELTVSEGSMVTAGQVIGRIVDPKLESQLLAAEAQISAAKSQLANAESELARYEELLTRGATTVQKVDQTRTAVEVARDGVTQAEAAQAVAARQISEGDVLAPADGRVLTVPARIGAVLMPGEPVATVAAGGAFLRLALPERHAEDLTLGAPVALQQGTGQIEKIYPQIEEGRVIVDVAVAGLSDAFMGKRVLVEVPVGARQVLAVPPEAIETRAGLDLVRIQGADGPVEVVVLPGAALTTAEGGRVEILTGLRAGDVVLLP